MTGKEYRRIKRDSYSSLKDFREDRKKYYKKYISEEGDDEEEEDEKMSIALKMGSLVDCTYFTPEEFESEFSMSAVAAPTATMGKFVNALYKHSKRYMDEDGVLTRSIEQLARDAYNDVKYNRNGDIVAYKRKNDTVEGVLEKFVDSDAELYYRHLLKSSGKITVELFQVQTAEKIVKELRTCWVTREIMNLASSKRYDVHNQLVILFTYNGYELKSMLDKVVVDHEAKTIQIWDLKTAYDNEEGFEGNFFKYRYYLQSAVYYLAALFWAEKEGWAGYTILPMKFIVADSANYTTPLIYTTDLKNLQQGLEGFFNKYGDWESGVNELVEDLAWHRKENIWTMSRKNYLSGGIIKLKPF